jgi:phosphoribosylformimino-5-aminoimidazole carboxamide ribotide isomerase
MRAGAGAIIMLDLARVGSSSGVDVELLRRVRAAAAGIEFVAGGGVRGAGDLDQLAAIGCDAVLVATALHTGALRAAHGHVSR